MAEKKQPEKKEEEKIKKRSGATSGDPVAQIFESE